MNDSTATTQNNGQQPQSEGPRFAVLGQYVKDLSFENPRAPAALTPPKDRPRIEAKVDVGVARASDTQFEVALKVNVSATSEEGPLFLVELNFAGLFLVEGADETVRERLLFVDAPFLLFPFARRIVSDVTRDGGFPQLMLEPIDFHGMYQQKRKQLAA